MRRNPSASTHVAGQLVRHYLATGKGSRRGPWAVDLDEDFARLLHYGTTMLTFTRTGEILDYSIGHGSVSDQAGVNAALRALGSSQRFSRDRRGGGPRINPWRIPAQVVTTTWNPSKPIGLPRAGEIAATIFKRGGPPHTGQSLEGVSDAVAKAYGLPRGDVYEMARRWLSRHSLRDNPVYLRPQRRTVMHRAYYDNPGGGMTMLLIAGAAVAAFMFLRPGTATAGSLTTPPAYIPPGYTFVPGRGLVPTSQVEGGSNVEGQLIAAGIGVAAPLVSTGIGALFGSMSEWFGGGSDVMIEGQLPAGDVGSYL